MKKNNIGKGIVCLLLAVIIFLTATGKFNVTLFAGIPTNKLVWTIILAVLGIGSLISFSWDGVIIAGGILVKMYDTQLGFEISTPVLIIIMILLIAACNAFFDKPEKKIMKHTVIDGNGSYIEKHNGDSDSGEILYYKNRFNGMTKYVNSENLKEVTIDSRFGGFELYLKDAKVPSGQLILDINAKCSGVEIYIPHNWTVVNNMRTIMCGVEESPRCLEEGETSPVELIITGKADKSGIEIARV